MGYSLIPMISITGFWAIVGFVLPWFAPKGPNKGYVCLNVSEINFLMLILR